MHKQRETAFALAFSKRTSPPVASASQTDAALKERALYPASAQFTFLVSVATLLATLMVFLCSPSAPRFKDPNPQISQHALTAVFFAVPVVFSEACFMVTSVMTKSMVSKTADLHEADLSMLDSTSCIDSLATLLEYFIMIVGGVSVWYFEGGVVIASPGEPTSFRTGPRPVYLGRIMMWMFALPILVFLVNRSCLPKANIPESWILLRSLPSMFATFTYCVATWMMQITTSRFGHWLLLVLILIAYCTASYDQLEICRSFKDIKHHGLKQYLIRAQLVIFHLYTVVLCAGHFGFLTPFQEQVFYCYSDAIVKVLNGAVCSVIRHYQDLESIVHWWRETQAVKTDFIRLVETACVPILTLTSDGDLMSWNGSLVKLTGFSQSQVHGKKIFDLADPSATQSLQRALARATGKEGVASGLVEISLERDPSSLLEDEERNVTLVMNFVPRFSQSGVLEAIVGIGQDLTQLCKLKAVEEKKTQLMGVVSHELRSPLHGIIGLAGMMSENTTSESNKRQLGMVKACASRLLDLVTNVMDLSESDKNASAKKAHNPCHPVNFYAVAEEVCIMTSLAVDKANKPLVKDSVKIINRLSEMTAIPKVLGDPYKCTQLLYNLLTNAAKFTKRGTITVQARHNREEKRLEVMVIDTGIGIPEASLSRIFLPFEQESSGKGDSRSFQGIGLGLAVCKNIADLHNAPIMVVSKVGQGTTFTVSFPCEDDSFSIEHLEVLPIPAPRKFTREVQEVQQVQLSRVQSQSSLVHDLSVRQDVLPTPAWVPTRKKPLILSVDDDEVNQEVMRSLFAKDYDVVVCMDGEDALRYLKTTKDSNKELPDLVLLDIQMPGLSGFEVCVEIRKSYEASKAAFPVLMVSARAPITNTAIQSFDSGSTDFIPKPFDKQLLRRKVDVFLSIRRDCLATGGPMLPLNAELLELKSWKETAIKEALEKDKDIIELKKQLTSAIVPTATEAVTETCKQKLEKEVQVLLGRLAQVVREKEALLEFVPEVKEQKEKLELHWEKFEKDQSNLSENASSNRMKEELLLREEMILKLSRQLACQRSCCRMLASQLGQMSSMTFETEVFFDLARGKRQLPSNGLGADVSQLP